MGADKLPSWLRDAADALGQTSNLTGVIPVLAASIVPSAAVETEAARSAKAEAEATVEEAAWLDNWPELAPRRRCWLSAAWADGYAISRRERFVAGLNKDPHCVAGSSSSLNYGELSNFCAFMGLLWNVLQVGSGIPRDGSATFADLGCGTGRVLLAAALLPCDRSPHPLCPFFANCFGVELLPGLAKAATAAGKGLQQQVLDAQCGVSCKMVGSCVGPYAAPVEVTCGDILESTVEWHCHDVVYAASTCFCPALFDGILERALQLRPGAVLITLQSPAGAPDHIMNHFFYENCGAFWMNESMHPEAHVLVRK